jgi:hypothetical protein
LSRDEFAGHPYGDCIGGPALEPNAQNSCDFLASGDTGVLTFSRAAGEPILVGISPPYFTGAVAHDAPAMVVDNSNSWRDGRLEIRNWGNATGEILAVELVGGDLVWDAEGDGCAGETLAQGTDSCHLQVFGTSGTLAFHTLGHQPQYLDVALRDLRIAPGRSGAENTSIITATPALSQRSDARVDDIDHWWISFTNEGQSDADILRVDARADAFAGNLRARSGSDCEGARLGANKNSPPRPGAQATCTVLVGSNGIPGWRNGLLRFTHKDGSFQDVPIELDSLLGLSTQAGDTTPPELSWTNPHSNWVRQSPNPAGSSSGVFTRTAIQTEGVYVHDPMGIDRVELSMRNLATGHVYHLGGVDYNCELPWPPPEEQWRNCQTTPHVAFPVTYDHHTVPLQHRRHADGSYKFIWKAWDSRGNMRVLETKATLLIDNSPPIVTLSGSLADSAYKAQMTGGYLNAHAWDAFVGTQWVEFKKLKPDQTWARRAFIERPRAQCEPLPCPADKKALTLVHTVDPVAEGWSNGTHDFDVKAQDFNNNPTLPMPWPVSYWSTSWQLGGVNDRRINTAAEVQAVRDRLGDDGYNNPANHWWQGLVPGDGAEGDQAIIYPISWALPNHKITSAADVETLRGKLGYEGYANQAVLDGISPADRPLVYPASWRHGNAAGAAHRIDTNADRAEAYAAVNALADIDLAGEFLNDVAPSDRDSFIDYMDDHDSFENFDTENDWSADYPTATAAAAIDKYHCWPIGEYWKVEDGRRLDRPKIPSLTYRDGAFGVMADGVGQCEKDRSSNRIISLKICLNKYSYNSETMKVGFRAIKCAVLSRSHVTFEDAQRVRVDMECESRHKRVYRADLRITVVDVGAHKRKDRVFESREQPLPCLVD